MKVNAANSAYHAATAISKAAYEAMQDAILVVNCVSEGVSVRNGGTGERPKLLSKREKEVLDCIRRNRMSNKEIAAELNISTSTVKFWMSRLLNKFKVDSRTKL